MFFPRFYVAFRQKSNFAATMLPPKKCLNTGVVEDWWQSGSKNYKINFLEGVGSIILIH